MKTVKRCIDKDLDHFYYLDFQPINKRNYNLDYYFISDNSINKSILLSVFRRDSSLLPKTVWTINLYNNTEYSQCTFEDRQTIYTILYS